MGKIKNIIRLNKEISGKILDIGGGGEGIIGRLYREQVTAIDKRQDELDEAPDGFTKIQMDAAALQFADSSFDHATFFFTLMFMNSKEQELAIREAARVVKSGGCLYIWDCDIACAYPEPFCIDVEVQLPDEHISTTYGVGKLDTQNAASIQRKCLDAGLTPREYSPRQDYFYMVFQKQ